MTRPIRYLLAALLALLVAPVSAQVATGSFDRTLNVSEPLALDVRTGAGAIEIRPGAPGRVEVHGDIRVGRSVGRAEAEALVAQITASPPIELAGSQLTIGRLDDSLAHKNVAISYRLTVPAATSVRSRTGSGAQTVAGVAGPVNAATGSGAVTLTDVRGAVEAATGSGSIEARGIAGAFNGRTGSGSVTLEQTAPGDVSVSTGSGSVDLSGVDGGARVRTGSGGITIAGTPSGEWALDAGSGSVRLRLPADAAFALDARAGSGSVTTSHPVTVVGTTQRGQLRGEVRGGGPTVRIRTGSGGISVE
jgi:hypothetical protein